MNRRAVSDGPCHIPMLRWATIILALWAWSNFAFCGEIHDAVQSGDLEKVKALLKTNRDLVFSKDKDGDTPLHIAAIYDRVDVAQSLLAKGAKINVEGHEGMTPLHYAAAYNH